MSRLEKVRNVLILEDNPDHATILQDFFSLHRILTVLTADVTEAQIIAERDQPSLIMMDPNLLGANRMDFVGVLKRNPATAKIPLLIVTADVMRITADTVRRAGAAAYLAKPFTLAELVEAIEKIFR